MFDRNSGCSASQPNIALSPDDSGDSSRLPPPGHKGKSIFPFRNHAGDSLLEAAVSTGSARSEIAHPQRVSGNFPNIFHPFQPEKALILHSKLPSHRTAVIVKLFEPTVPHQILRRGSTQNSQKNPAVYHEILHHVFPIAHCSARTRCISEIGQTTRA